MVGPPAKPNYHIWSIVKSTVRERWKRNSIEFVEIEFEKNNLLAVGAVNNFLIFGDSVPFA